MDDQIYKEIMNPIDGFFHMLNVKQTTTDQNLMNKGTLGSRVDYKSTVEDGFYNHTSLIKSKFELMKTKVEDSLVADRDAIRLKVSNMRDTYTDSITSVTNNLMTAIDSTNMNVAVTSDTASAAVDTQIIALNTKFLTINDSFTQGKNGLSDQVLKTLTTINDQIIQE